ncbi:hypothetical protein ACHZ97_11180 [Lysobacter soli]|uniref:hypothetical protein n=1 Tax=Lysobacter soli TaxID=453783 RepID=UPI0037C91A3A
MNAPAKSKAIVASRFGYPFKDKQEREITDPQALYEGLSFVQGGHYLLGAHGFDDCLSIRRGLDGYHVELRSTQAEQHVCAFDLTMKGSNERLTFESEFGPVAIVQEDEALQISSAGIDPTALGLGFCGAHADIDRLRFPLSAKREIRGGCSLDAQH